ncbi:ATP-binding cassette domain-containing protein [Bacillus cereus]|nr:ATP-binding cassette domain-containing protein [Bacillus cereus]
MGKNGAGKSTLLKIITRLIVPTNGKVIFFFSQNVINNGKII